MLGQETTEFVAISLYGSPNHQKETITDLWKLFQKVSHDLALKFSRYSYTYFKSETAPIKCKEGDFTTSEELLVDILNAFDKFTPGSIELYSAPPKRSIAREPDLGIIYAIKDRLAPYSQVTIVIKREILSGQQSNMDGYIETLLRRIADAMPVTYGLVRLMTSDQYPVLYFGDFPPHDISPPDMQKHRAWIRQRSFYGQRLWDIFWGNLVRADLISAHIPEIEALVGNGHMHFIGNSTLVYFTLPVPLVQSKSIEAEVIAENLRRILPAETLMFRESSARAVQSQSGPPAAGLG